jgi:N-methylhydantoinase A
MNARLAVDIGGTFTDVVGFDPTTRTLSVGKTLSTPRALVDGIHDAVGDAGLAMTDAAALTHGSTVVINALIERKGARAAIVTTRGFRDVYEIGRVNRPDAFNLRFRKHEPLVPRKRVLEVDERLRADGSVQRALEVDEARALARRLRAMQVDAVAVVLLHSYRNPAHELLMGRVLADELPDCHITLSHELTREYREFERTSTAAANAFVGPVVSRYLRRLEDAVGADAQLSIMQSNGGLADIATIRRQCVQMMESGPAGGVVGTIELCKKLGLSDAIAFDMGGTTAKAAVVRDQQFPQATEYFVGGYVRGLPIRIPCLDIVEVGTGGGSIAWLDEADGLHVGPRSAGADPGPACYGRGGLDATVTDAAVVLGLLDPQGDLSGGLHLDVAAARTALGRVADRVGLTTEAVASGILQIAAAEMANAVRAVTTERGLDPRDFTLFAYGGNGPLHISLVAGELGIGRVVVPPVPAVFAALGMLMADVRHDLVLTAIRRLNADAWPAVCLDYDGMEQNGLKVLLEQGVAEDRISFRRYADMRYVGQEHSLTVELPSAERTGTAAVDALKATFDRAHGERFGHNAPDEEAEFVSLRVSVIGAVPRPEWRTLARGAATAPAAAVRGARELVLDSRRPPARCTVYDRAGLLAGNRIAGPAVIEEGTTTTLLRAGDTAQIDDLGDIVITIGTAP